jgi:hypothetical protein
LLITLFISIHSQQHQYIDYHNYDNNCSLFVVGLRILEAGVAITTIVTGTNSNATTVATKLNNAVSTVQAALVTAGFPATVASATVATISESTAIPISNPTFRPSSLTATVDTNTKGKSGGQRTSDD